MSNKEKKRKKKMSFKDDCLTELEAGHLLKAIKIVEDNRLPIDQDLKEAAAEACIGSLKRHFHWIIPLFVTTFGIKDHPEVKKLANTVVQLALENRQLFIAGRVAETFGVTLDSFSQSLVEEDMQKLINSINKATGAIVVEGNSGEYDFEL